MPSRLHLVAKSSHDVSYVLLSVPQTYRNWTIINGATDRYHTAAFEKDSRSFILTLSNSFTLGGHSDGSWHIQPGLLSASSLHVFPRLQRKLSHGSKTRNKHCNDLCPMWSSKTVSVNNLFIYSVITGPLHIIPLHSTAIWVCRVIKFNLISLIHSLSLQSCVLVVTVKQSGAIHAEVLAK